MDIRLRNIRKSYNGREILSLPELNFASGQISCLMGANGCGKTTLLRIMAGLEQADAGQILFSGQSPGPALRREMTYVHQKPFHFRRSVRENIHYPLQLRGQSPSEQKKRSDELLELFQLSHLAKSFAPTLSGGESQRLALARALSFKPKYLFLDEVTASLDELSIVLIERIFRTYLQEKECCLIWVTHERAQCERLDALVIQI